MEIQSLSVCVPGGCPNRCRFCVSRMHREEYPNVIEKDSERADLWELDYLKRLQFSRDNGCNTLVLTGAGEPAANLSFLGRLAAWNEAIADPFRWIELQTSGVTVDEEKLQFFRETVGVATISLSLSDLFDSGRNAEINGTPDKRVVDVPAICAAIREHGFNLRLSLNMSDVYNDVPIARLIDGAAGLGANQVTFRKLYMSGNPEAPEDRWIHDHLYVHMDALQEYIVAHGRMLEVLPFGAIRYAIRGMSVVLDSDCMSTEAKDVIKYLVLRPDCRLYTKWDDKGSLLF